MVSFNDDNGWQEWKKHVLSELQRINNQCENRCSASNQHYLELWKKIEDVEREMLSRFSELNSEISALQVKAGFWGAVGAALVLLAPVLLKLLLKL
jgi:hypothetical protein